jgi:hypothetical protein
MAYMNTKTFTDLLANPQNISAEDLHKLNSVLEKYPYFQSARALQLKGLKNDTSYLYNDALKLTAAYTTDRNILFDYITSVSFKQNEISEGIQQHDDSVFELNVIPEDVSEEVSLEIDKQIKAELKKAEAILNPKLFERKLKSVEKIVDERTTPETILDINIPLDFTKEDPHSFSEWLKLTSAKPINREEKKTTPSKKEQKFHLIDKFIQDKPKLIPNEIHSDQLAKTTKSKNLADQYTLDQGALMTETLAKVYLQQKNYKKALQAYTILSLKYPEKSGFLADQIRAIKKLINIKET